MTAQVRIWVVTDDFDPRGITDTDETTFVPEPRRAVENEFVSENIVLGCSHREGVETENIVLGYN